jgi:hypothetical protein
MAAVSAMTQMYAAIRVATGAAGILNAVLGKNPIIKIVGALMAIGGAVVAVKQVDDLFADLDKKAESVKNNVASQVKEEEKTVTQKRLYNDAQEKALIAFGETITKLAQETQYQKDIIALGETEAKVRKVIAEENDKLAKVGLTLNTQQEQMVRLVIKEGDELKRNTTLRKEQSDTINGLLSGVSSVSKEVDKLEDIKLQFQGYTKADIEKFKEARALQMPGAEQKALSNQRKNINDSVNAELGKYDLFLAAETKYQKELSSLQEIQQQAQSKNITLSIEQEAAFANSKLMIEKQYQDDRLKAVQDMNNKIRDIEVRRIEDVLMSERSGIAQALSDKDRQTLQNIGAAEKQKAIVADRIAFEKKSDLEKAQFAIDQGAQMYTALGAQNKKAFEAAKAFNIANAIINTYAAATKALATYPPPFSFIAAAAAVGMGLAQVAQIRAQTYSGKALGGPVMGGQPYLVGENGPEIFTPNTTGNITRNSDIGGGGPTNVNFTIVANDAQGFDDLLLQRRGMITQMISDAMLERGSRSMV